MRVLIAGATGYLGRHLVAAAEAAGHHVRALARRDEGLGAETFVAEATRPATLAGICDDIEVVISALGNRSTRRAPTVWDVDYAANLHLVHRAREARVRRFVFVSVLDGPRARESVPQADAREAVVDELLRHGPPATIVRPSGFFNDLGAYLDMARTGTLWLVGDGRARLNPIHGADLAKAIVSRLDEPPGAYDIGGPEVLSQREIAGLAFEALGRTGTIRRVPAALVARGARLVTPWNENAGSLMALLAHFGRGELVAPAYGHRRLADFFRERVTAAGPV